MKSEGYIPRGVEDYEEQVGLADGALQLLSPRDLDHLRRPCVDCHQRDCYYEPHSVTSLFVRVMRSPRFPAGHKLPEMDTIVTHQEVCFLQFSFCGFLQADFITRGVGVLSYGEVVFRHTLELVGFSPDCLY